jgi:hypothetical protein
MRFVAVMDVYEIVHLHQLCTTLLVLNMCRKVEFTGVGVVVAFGDHVDAVLITPQEHVALRVSW